MHYTSKTFWLNTLDRAIRTFAQVLITLLGAENIGIVDVDWLSVLSIALMAVLLSVLTSLATPNVVAEGAVEAYQARHSSNDGA